MPLANSCLSSKLGRTYSGMAKIKLRSFTTPERWQSWDIAQEWLGLEREGCSCVRDFDIGIDKDRKRRRIPWRANSGTIEEFPLFSWFKAHGLLKRARGSSLCALRSWDRTSYQGPDNSNELV